MNGRAQIAQTSQEAYARINPDEALPSGDPRYVPLDPARGTRNVAQSLKDRILAQEAASIPGSQRSFARFLLTGHGGCGKTTELNRLKHLLAEAGFAVVYFDAASEFDLQKQDLSWWNVLLEMVWQIDSQLSQPPLNVQVPDELRDAATEWLARVVTKKTERRDMEASLSSEFSVGVRLPFFAKAKAAVKALVKAGSSTVREIEREAERRPDVLRDSVNDIVSHVNQALQASGHRGLVIVADGLEKIPLRTVGEGLTTHSLLFIHAGRMLQAPPCHIIYTLPLALLARTKISEVFPEHPVVMPMVHVRHSDGKPDGKALALMAQVIERRVAQKLFSPGVVRMLALASGGHIRDLLHLVRDAASGFRRKIGKADAERAIANLTDFYNRLIEAPFIGPLDYVAEHRQLRGDPLDGELVNRLLVLEYRNRDAWTSLHPCVQACPRFLRAPRASQQNKPS
ncbi:MAG: hypothetical protein FJ279_29215 [Planctomycetes bacterium]|nr:hypothetical protein [Planctomycetota bacterium]